MRDEWKDRLLYTETKRGPVLRNVLANVVTILGNDPRWEGVLAYDRFGETVITAKPPPWSTDDAPAVASLGDWLDEHDARVSGWFSRAYDLDVSIGIVRDAVAVVAARRPVHPVVELLARLEWDGTPRVDTWLCDYLGAKDTPYTRAVAAIFLLSAVARVQQPGCKVDTVPILESPQGRGKSTVLRELAGEAFFLETGAELGSKDSFQQLRRKWIVELAELDALSRADVARIKAFLSARVDTYRPSYGRRATDHPRQCIFVGTTNSATYLKDDTGGRRFLPVRCDRIDLAGLRGVRDQLWAEARVRYERGERWHIEDAALLRSFEAEQEARFQADPWEQAIAGWLLSAGRPERRIEGVTTADVLAGALAKDQGTWTRADEMRVAAVLRRLGWERPPNAVWRDGVRIRPFLPKVVQVVSEVVSGVPLAKPQETQPTQPA
jgi:putative DNA primase/helicase